MITRFSICWSLERCVQGVGGGDENKKLFQSIFHNSFHFQKLSIKLLMSHEINVQCAFLAAGSRVNLEHLLSFSFVEVLLLSV